MKFEVAIVIAVVWFIIRAIARANKKKKADLLQRGGQNTNNSTNTAQDFIDTTTAEARQTAAAAERETHYLDLPVEEVKTRITDPFYVPKNLEDNTSSHYNEDNLVTEYEETHAAGKTVAHHKHKLFDASKDRSKASRHTSYAGKPNSARQASSAPTTHKRTERKAKAVNPIATALKSKSGLKQAFIMAEVLKRPEF